MKSSTPHSRNETPCSASSLDSSQRVTTPSMSTPSSLRTVTSALRVMNMPISLVSSSPDAVSSASVYAFTNRWES